MLKFVSKHATGEITGLLYQKPIIAPLLSTDPSRI